MRILGIDPALRITGYGVIETRKNKPILVEAGVIKTYSGNDIVKRLDKIYRAILKLVTDTKPDVLVLEKLYAHYRHPATAFLLGQARGVICLVAAHKKIHLVEYGATRIKKAIVGVGNASKLQVQKMVTHALNIDNLPRYSDVTDALALAIAHSHIGMVKL